MGLNNKDVIAQLKSLCHVAEDAFPHLRTALVITDEDAMHEVSHTIPRGLPADSIHALIDDKSSQNPIQCLGISTNKKLDLFNIINWKKEKSIISVDLRSSFSKEDLPLAFWRSISVALDLNAYLNMLRSKKQDYPDLMPASQFPLHAQSNLRTDLFAGLTLAFEHESDAPLKALMRERAEAPFHRIKGRGCHKHPSVIAYDAAIFALETTLETIDHITPCKNARRLAIDIVKGFDKNALTGWEDFAIPARDMSLRGYPTPTILSGALCVSDKPHIRSVAHNCAILLGHESVLDEPEELDYNAFDSDQSNLVRHEQYAKKLFEKALYEAKKRSCIAPLHEEANRQNLRLTQGQITGWCADSLQLAAEAFDARLQETDNPHIDTLPKLADYKKSTATTYQEWNQLRRLSETVIDRKGKGQITTLSTLNDITEMDDKNSDTGTGFGKILSSIQTTMTNSFYLSKLEAANKTPQRPLPAFKTEPAAPAPRAAPTPQPVPVPTPFGTSMEVPNSAKHNQGEQDS